MAPVVREPVAKTRQVLLFLLATLAAVLVGIGHNGPVAAQGVEEASGGYLIPFTSAQKGRALFVGKGCVVCHSVNGVGGAAAPALDSDPQKVVVDPFDFAARMWRGAPTMIILQEMELGYQIDLTGQDLAQIVHFLNDPIEQSRFGDEDIPELIRDWMVDDVYEQLNSDDWAQ